MPALTSHARGSKAPLLFDTTINDAVRDSLESNGASLAKAIEGSPLYESANASAIDTLSVRRILKAASSVSSASCRSGRASKRRAHQARAFAFVSFETALN